MTVPEPLAIHPVAPGRLPDLVRLFQGHGNPAYCWCMLWRVPTKVYRGTDAAGRRALLEDRVRAGTPVGLLAYEGEAPVGWCSVAPRETYERLERSRTMPRVDAAIAFSIVCFFVPRAHRRRGVPLALLDAAIDTAAAAGADVLEAYPAPPGGPSYRFMGSRALFERAGFAPSAANDRIWRHNLSSGAVLRNGDS